MDENVTSISERLKLNNYKQFKYLLKVSKQTTPT